MADSMTVELTEQEAEVVKSCLEIGSCQYEAISLERSNPEAVSAFSSAWKKFYGVDW